MINTPEMYEFKSMVDFADHMIDEHGMIYDCAYFMDRYGLHDQHIRAHTMLGREDLQRILDVFLTINNSDPYPINDITKAHFEEIIEKIDHQLDTGWTGFGYTIWMKGVEP